MAQILIILTMMLTYGEAQSEVIPADICTVKNQFQLNVKQTIEVPVQEQLTYAFRLKEILEENDLSDISSQFILVVDRNPFVQAIFIYWNSPQGSFNFIGASLVSTGKPGAYDHFITPLGLFRHEISNMDFRSEGTKNDLGIRGYGKAGMRVYDFGWVVSERTWGKYGLSTMRLQMHSTDPDFLEIKLGQPESKGCIRISADLNAFLDHYGLLDASYYEAIKKGEHLWLFSGKEEPVSTPGRYLVVLDTYLGKYPPWLLSCIPDIPPPIFRDHAIRSSVYADSKRCSIYVKAEFEHPW